MSAILNTISNPTEIFDVILWQDIIQNVSAPYVAIFRGYKEEYSCNYKSVKTPSTIEKNQ